MVPPESAQNLSASSMRKGWVIAQLGAIAVPRGKNITR